MVVDAAGIPQGGAASSSGQELGPKTLASSSMEGMGEIVEGEEGEELIWKTVN
jgi:hypothetical protein